MADFHEVAPNGEVDLIMEHPEQVATDVDSVFEDIPIPQKLHFRRSGERGAPCSTPSQITVLRADWNSENFMYSGNIPETELIDEQPATDPEVESSMILAEDTASVSSENCVRIRVSSEHLILASSYFKRNLESGMLESHILSSEGRVNIPMKDGDPEAMLIIMNIIHGRTRKVPRRVAFDMLLKIAILVDYLECHEPVEPFSDMWIEALKGNMSYTYSKELIQWLCISIVFHKEYYFKNLTSAAILQAKGPIKTLGLPIRESVVECINLRRNYVLHRMFLALDDLLGDLREDRGDCAFECNALRYGALVKELSCRGLLFPRPVPPFLGYSFENISASIARIQDPQMDDKSSKPITNSYYHTNSNANSKPHICQLKSLITPITKAIGQRIHGLYLSDFPKVE